LLPEIVSVVFSTGIASGSKLPTISQAYSSHCGKAPSVDPFTAEDAKTTFYDFRASSNLEWLDFRGVIGYLSGKEAQEWKLLLPEEVDYHISTRLDSGNQVLAALDVCYISQ